MNGNWLTTREAAERLGISIRAVEKNCAQDKYIIERTKSRRGLNGYLIDPRSLPLAVQPESAPGTSAPAIEPVGKPEDQAMARMSEAQRKEALRRLEILQQWKHYAAETGRGPDQAAEDFIQYGLDDKCSVGTLYRWQRNYRDNGLAGLAPQWSAGSREAFDEESFCENAQRRAKQIYLNQSRVSMRQVWVKVGKEGRLREWRVPGYHTMRRFLAAIPLPSRIYAREGKKAFEDKAVPAILRSLEGLAAMDIIECDHHQLDVAVMMKDQGVMKAVFPWLTLWLDVRARRPLGWTVTTSPDTWAINQSLQRTIMKYGIPKAVHIDNGKDFRARIFRGEQGRFKLEETTIKVDLKPSLIEGIYGTLGIRTHWAIPYNAKTKVIERFFQTLRREFSVGFRGYRGKNTIEKPEKLKDEVRRGRLISFEELVRALDSWLENEYACARPHQGLGMRTPAQVFAENLKETRRVKAEELVLLCMPYPRPVRVGNNGIYLFGDYYWDDRIAFERQGQQVLIRHAEDKPQEVYVMDLQGRFLGTAEKRNPGTWNMSEDDYRKQLRLKKSIREAIMPYRQLAAELSDDDREKLFLGLISEVPAPELTANETTIETPFKAVIEEEKKKREERKILSEQAADFGRMFAAAARPDNGREQLEKAAEEFLRSYNRTGGLNERNN